MYIYFSVHEDETDAMLGEYNGNGETTEMYEIPIHNGEKPGLLNENRK